MATQPAQHYANHTRFHPWYHVFTTPLSLAYLVWSLVRLDRAPGADALFDVTGAVLIFALLGFVRLYPMKVQDRVIRLEERLRLARLLPADLQPSIDKIATRHLIAIRFAADAEVPELVRKVLADPTLAPKAIKQQIRDWRADHFRV